MSDVLVKGMDMPTAGRILIVLPSGRTLEVSADETQNIFREAQAVTVPSHGRLGDLDELYVHLNEWYLTNNPVFTKEERIYIRAMLLGISEAPTIIPADKAEEGKT